MTPLNILFAIAALFVLFLIVETWRHYSARGVTPNSGELLVVDLDAFENLTDPEEEQFLRVNLTAAEFRDVQRSRIRAARMYVKALSKNASVLMAVGQSASAQPDEKISATGREIVQQSVRLHRWCKFSRLRLETALVFPHLISPSNRIAGQYVLVSRMAANLPRKAAA